jgi:hypothetical protein
MAFNSYPSKGGIPGGTTAARPSGAILGDTYYNGTLGLLEIYDGSNWVPCSAPAGIPTFTQTDVGTSRPYTSGAIAFTITAGTNGGSPYGYTATSTSGTPTTYTTGTQTSTTPTLSVGGPGSYSSSITAYNGFGTSPSSPAASITVTTIPETITIGSASTSNTTSDVTVTWTNGATGGKVLSSIKVNAYSGATLTGTYTAATTSSTSLVIAGLTFGTAYTFKVFATNANGDSALSAASNSITAGLPIAYTVVGGGGGGGGGESNNAGDGGGGGGAGGVIQGTKAFAAGTYSVEVGSGAAGNYNPGGPSFAANGSLSRIHQSGTTYQSLTVAGGGGGGTNDGAGQNGACGGGASGDTSSYGTASVGFDGGAGTGRSGGGGGGMGSVGTSLTTGGNGGAGITETIKSTQVAGGGAGGRGSSATGYGTASFGGGSGADGTANTGGGGSGAYSGPRTGFNGGAGVVIVKIPGSASATTGSPTVTTAGGFTTYQFNAAGSFTI